MKVLKDETLNILLAGRDTTAVTLTFAVYKLSQHPDILQRLREEILATVGSSRPPHYDDIRDMKYLRAFINETLRLYPPVYDYPLFLAYHSLIHDMSLSGQLTSGKHNDCIRAGWLIIDMISSHRTSTKDTVWPSQVPGGKPFYIPSGTRSDFIS